MDVELEVLGLLVVDDRAVDEPAGVLGREVAREQADRQVGPEDGDGDQVELAGPEGRRQQLEVEGLEPLLGVQEGRVAAGLVSAPR